MVVPVIWEREALEPEEEPVKHPLGILALWGKRGGPTFDEEDQQLAGTLAQQAAALLVEEHLEEFEDIQTAFATVPVGLMLINTEGSIVVANVAACQILQVNILQGKHLRQIDSRGQLQGLISELQPGAQSQATASFITPSGETYAASVQLAREGQSILAFTRSPFSTAAEELVGQVAHELRTPLTVIQGNLQTIQTIMDEGVTEEDLQIADEFIGTALIQSSRMFRLISETLNISRIHAGKEIELEVTEFDLIEALDQILIELDDKLAGHQLVRQAPEALTIEGDRDKVMSILDNYLKNSAKYANPGTTITVSIKKQDGEVAIEVRDAGIGISPEDIERIGHEPGFRTSASKDQAGGIGLGMVYVRRVTEAHDGRVEIQSELGEGSVFRSVLPMHQPSSGSPTPDLELL
ncbi:MAG: HAMP domain-containing histidine kinase [Armatimonadetes bacterium]|nr:HAMP domain-containing histidine kinase [Armatimonadota bacterium]